MGSLVPSDFILRNSGDEAVPDVEGDRISDLPDHLLLKILSIIPIECAVTTMILSKRWQYVWTYLDHLCFTYETYAPKIKIAKFVSFVDNVLLLSRCTKLKKFFLDVNNYYPEYTRHISDWLRWAISKNVENLFLYFDKRESDHYLESRPFSEYRPLCVDQNIFSCSSLVTLCTRKCKFLESCIISWKFLTRLTMKCIVLDDGIMVKLLSGCPLLEALEFMSFSGFNNLSITNPNLKKLMLVDYWLPGWVCRHDNVLKISAPYIKELKIAGRLKDLQCMLVDVSSLVLADVPFELSWANRPHGFQDVEYHIALKVGKELIQSLAHVQELVIGTWLLQVLASLGKEDFSYLFSNCDYMTLYSYFSSFEFPAVVSMLENSPQLETLVINMGNFGDFFYRDTEASSENESENFMHSQYQNMECLALRLKTVIITVVQNGCIINDAQELWWDWNILGYNIWENELAFTNFEPGDHHSEELLDANLVDPFTDKDMYRRLIFEKDKGCMFAEFLLKNGQFLEEVFIVYVRRVCSRCYTCCEFDYLSLVAEKLSTIPKLSTGAAIKFIERSEFSSKKILY